MTAPGMKELADLDYHCQRLALKPYSQLETELSAALAREREAREASDAVADALQNMGDFWAYGLQKTEGAVPAEEEMRTVTQLATTAKDALAKYRALKDAG